MSRCGDDGIGQPPSPAALGESWRGAPVRYATPPRLRVTNIFLSRLRRSRWMCRTDHNRALGRGDRDRGVYTDDRCCTDGGHRVMCYAARMPRAKPPAPPKPVAELASAEAILVREAVIRIFGTNAVVRNWGTAASELRLHVEADDVAEPRVSELLGLLYARIDRDRIGVDFTKRGTRVSGQTKIAYRQGVIL